MKTRATDAMILALCSRPLQRAVFAAAAASVIALAVWVGRRP